MSDQWDQQAPTINMREPDDLDVESPPQSTELVPVPQPEPEGDSALRRGDVDAPRPGKADGVLGFGLFADCLLTLDYPANVVRLRLPVRSSTIHQRKSSVGVAITERTRREPLHLAVRRSQAFAVLVERDETVIHRLGERNAAAEARRIGALGDEPLGARIDPGLVPETFWRALSLRYPRKTGAAGDPSASCDLRVGLLLAR